RYSARRSHLGHAKCSIKRLQFVVTKKQQFLMGKLYLLVILLRYITSFFSNIP
ncbi:MAG: hypothetical protein ACI9QV_001367, partial [Methylophagaceae bacterium]